MASVVDEVGVDKTCGYGSGFEIRDGFKSSFNNELSQLYYCIIFGASAKVVGAFRAVVVVGAAQD